MFEKIKSAMLLFLIISSMFLTYRLWFGQPPLEEESMPHYEEAFFTAPPASSGIIKPAQIIFYDNDRSIHLYRRGSRGFERLWSKSLNIIKENVELNNAKNISKSDLEGLTATFSSRLVYNFEPSMPLMFMTGTSVFEDITFERAVFLWDEELIYVIFVGEENFLLPLGRTEDLQRVLLPVLDNTHKLLPPVIELALPRDEDNEGGVKNEAGEVNEKEADDVGIAPGNGGDIKDSDEQQLSWEIETRGEIYVPEGDIQAAEVRLKEEEIDHEQLVRAFFIDLSLARLIEERDGALYYTDGEKGLRIYPSGLVEFAFPRLERNLGNISYSHALQKGAESISLYGGWPSDTYLEEVENRGRSYRLLWGTIYDGLAFKGEQTGCEMEINDQGVSFYRRNICLAGEDISGKMPFRPYDEVLYRILSLNEQFFKENAPVLLALEPVYYIPPVAGKVEKAIPAWSVHFQGMEKKYLHWVTLDPL